LKKMKEKVEITRFENIVNKSIVYLVIINTLLEMILKVK